MKVGNLLYSQVDNHLWKSLRMSDRNKKWDTIRVEMVYEVGKVAKTW